MKKEKKKKELPLKVVVDTSVLISAFAFGGAPAHAIREFNQRATIYVSPPLLQEYREVPLELEREGDITRE
ncbi:MAG: PIN domain-containing protein, partial [Candidatus Korarchaeota archaeon]|nr:PIN domain-containing protein [Candidatus Korarchaeota archaeon]NIU84810.1 hypothetical protein [Candidatus Thorarchaeota archaeon]NIW14141.1 hypothetical protein [Candidatus Thorarchaeota archaeon]NIW52864.1 hypothetical protein [Candidatus Korarchaeota archaeon]